MMSTESADPHKPINESSDRQLKKKKTLIWLLVDYGEHLFFLLLFWTVIVGYLPCRNKIGHIGLFCLGVHHSTALFVLPDFDSYPLRPIKTHTHIH